MKKRYRTATLKVFDEFRRMKVGDVVHFPLSEYNYNTLRAAPAGLMNERAEGKDWKLKTVLAEKYVEVTRIS